MAKRKGVDCEQSQHESESPSEESASEESGSDEDTNMLDVEFEWFDPQPAHDFHGIKTLLRQLFDADAQTIDLSAFTDLILAQPLLGSTVKTDGNESDPYAFLSVLNLREHQDKPVIRGVHDYLKGRAKTTTLSSELLNVLGAEKSTIGLILTERLINVPSEVVPPMYNMLLEELTWALEEKEPYDFSHYLILSKTYQEVDSIVDNENIAGGRKLKKQKKASGLGSSGTFYFHPEDEVLQKHALAHTSFEYANAVGEGQSDSKRTFQELGIKPTGHLILIEGAKFKGAVEAMQAYFKQT